MDQEIVRRLEKKIEETVSDVISEMEETELPLLPSRQTMHLMAKAAVTVYEAAVENRDGARDE